MGRQFNLQFPSAFTVFGRTRSKVCSCQEGLWSIADHISPLSPCVPPTPRPSTPPKHSRCITGEQITLSTPPWVASLTRLLRPRNRKQRLIFGWDGQDGSDLLLLQGVEEGTPPHDHAHVHFFHRLPWRGLRVRPLRWAPPPRGTAACRIRIYVRSWNLWPWEGFGRGQQSLARSLFVWGFLKMLPTKVQADVLRRPCPAATGNSFITEANQYCEERCMMTKDVNSVVGCICETKPPTTELPTVVFLSPAIGLIMVGIFTFFTSILGCAGAIRERNLILSFYICAILLVIILQFSFGVAAATVASGDSSAIQGPIHAVLKKNYKLFNWRSLDIFFPAACYKGSQCAPPHAPCPTLTNVVNVTAIPAPASRTYRAAVAHTPAAPLPSPFPERSTSLTPSCREWGESTSTFSPSATSMVAV